MTHEPIMRPAPQPTALGRPFWDAARAHRLVRPVCERCGHQWFTPTAVCPACQSEAWAWTDSSGMGAVHSFTVVHRAPLPGFEVPYVLADVDLDEGWHMLSNVIGCAPSEVGIAMPVQVTFIDVAEGGVLPVFAPRPPAPATRGGTP